MRVLYLDGSKEFGGATRSLFLVLSRLTDVNAALVTSHPEDARRLLPGVRIHTFRQIFDYRLRMRLDRWLERRAPGGWTSRLARTLYAAGAAAEMVLITSWIVFIARRFRADLLHLNTGPSTPGGLTAGRLAGIPRIVHLRGFLTPRRWFRRNFRHATHVIGVSDAVSRSAVKAGIPPARVTTVYDPVDVEVFDRARPERDAVRAGLGLPPGAVAIGIFGRIIPWKGQWEFVRAAGLAMDRNPLIHAVLVGNESDGLPEYFGKIRAWIADSPHRERFHLAGFVSDVERLYVAMDIVVHASIDPEPFGMVVIEGMAAGRPVIATAPGGPSEIVQSGVDGVLVAAGDVEAMAARILDLAEDSDRRTVMGRRAYEKVRDRFSVALSAQGVRDVYDAVLRPQGRGAPAAPERGRAGTAGEVV